MARKYCKECGEALTKELINNGRKYCSKGCRKELMHRNRTSFTKQNTRKNNYHGVVFDCDGNSQ